MRGNKFVAGSLFNSLSTNYCAGKDLFLSHFLPSFPVRVHECTSLDLASFAVSSGEILAIFFDTARGLFVFSKPPAIIMVARSLVRIGLPQHLIINADLLTSY